MPKYTAKTADKHDLYQQSVQCPEADVAFIRRVFHKRFGRYPTHLREDFCGTAWLACEWVKAHRDNEAVGVDLDRPTLDWGRKHNLSRLSDEQAARVELIHGDVMKARTGRVDVVAALNFSYFLFKELDALVTYFRKARGALRPEGMLLLDAYGGWEAQQLVEESTPNNGFTYVWDQDDYNPVTDEAVCHIHFRFPDGSRMRRAFTYHWRLWTMGGVRDALQAAGFRDVEVYWEGTDADGDGNGVFRRQHRAENSAGWIAYVVAYR